MFVVLLADNTLQQNVRRKCLFLLLAAEILKSISTENQVYGVICCSVISLQQKCVCNNTCVAMK